VIVPQLAGTVHPLTLQVTFVLLSLEVTFAVNCCVVPAGTLALVGEIVIVIVGAVNVTVAMASLVVSATEVAVMVSVRPAGKTVGAVYKPLEFIVPIVASPPFSPFTAQVTEVLLFPVTVAVNCWVPPPAMLAVAGETVTATVVLVVVLFDPPHPSQTAVIKTIRTSNRLMKVL
jgi:hypothetical protein